MRTTRIRLAGGNGIVTNFSLFTSIPSYSSRNIALVGSGDIDLIAFGGLKAALDSRRSFVKSSGSRGPFRKFFFSVLNCKGEYSEKPGARYLIGLFLFANQVAQFLVALLDVNRAAESLVQVDGHPPYHIQECHVAQEEAAAKPREAVEGDAGSVRVTRPRNKYRTSFQPPDRLARYRYFPARPFSHRDRFHLSPLWLFFGCTSRAKCWHCLRTKGIGFQPGTSGPHCKTVLAVSIAPLISASPDRHRQFFAASSALELKPNPDMSGSVEFRMKHCAATRRARLLSNHSMCAIG